DDDQFRRAAVHELIDLLASDVLRAASDRLERLGFSSANQAITCSEIIVAESLNLQPQKAELEQFLFNRVYRHPQVLRERELAVAALETIFDAIVERPESLPGEHRGRAEEAGLRRATADYLAGMTDRFAWDARRKLADG
ncbi:MAG: deoxyguanosinetriphosphate triphosphohydrolase, partial [Planctomycetota bacterium]